MPGVSGRATGRATGRGRAAEAAYAAQAVVFRAAMALPEPAQRLLAGRPVVRDGQTLAPETQLMLRLQRLAREVGAESLPIPEGREATRLHARLVAGRQPVEAVRELTVAGRPARLYVPTSHPGTPSPLLVFFHGGGFVWGDLDSHDAPCRFLAERAATRVLSVDYRLAPEHPFPAAYDDALAAYGWVVEHVGDLGGGAGRLAVGGDSAGGNLAAGVALEAARRGWPCAVQLLVYPATQLDRDTESLRLFGDGFYLTEAYIDLANAHYAPPGTDLCDPRLSPIYADVPPGLAPALVVTAGFDPLRDEGEAYARKLADAGVDLELCRFPDQIHGFLNIVGTGRRSRAAVAEIAAKLRAALHPHR